MGPANQPHASLISCFSSALVSYDEARRARRGVSEAADSLTARTQLAYFFPTKLVGRPVHVVRLITRQKFELVRDLKV